MADEKYEHPGPSPKLWDLRFGMLALTFALLWVYLVAQGATAFSVVSGNFYLGLAPSLAIEIGEVVALLLWSSEAKSKLISWQFAAVFVAGCISAVVQYIAADSIASEAISFELKTILSVGVAVLAVALGKSAGERFSAWQAEFGKWKAAEEMWNWQEERRKEAAELAEKKRKEEMELAEQKRISELEYRRERAKEREERERQSGTVQRKEKAEEVEEKATTPPQKPLEISETYMEHLKVLLSYIEREGPVESEAAFSIMNIGKSQGYKVLSAGRSAGILEKSGKRWRQRDGKSDVN